MRDFSETIMLHPGAGFFTADTAGAVHDDIFIFMFLHHLNGLRQLIAKSICRDLQRVLEMADLILVMVAHINKDRVRVVQHRVNFSGLQIIPHV